MIFLSVRPGVKTMGVSGIWNVSFSFFVKVCMDSLIVPLVGSWWRSRPIKSLGCVNLTSKYSLNLFWMSVTSFSGPEIKASST